MFPCLGIQYSKIDDYTSITNYVSVSTFGDKVDYQDVVVKLCKRYTLVGTDVPKYLCPAAPPKFPPSPNSGGNQPPSMITHNPAPLPNPLTPAPDSGKAKEK
jgi:hypothetical protein